MLRLRAKRGKLLLEISTRIRWPLSICALVDHRADLELVDLAGLHEDLLVVALTEADPLDGLVDVVGRAVGVDIDQLDGEVGVLGVGADIERRRRSCR